MKPTKVVLLSIVALLFSLSSLGVYRIWEERSWSEARHQYELEERCSRRMAELFKAAYPERSTTSIARYMNHYNKKANKCFAVTSIGDLIKPGSLVIMKLTDVNESRDIGTYWVEGSGAPTTCKVGDTVCRSHQEWEALIKPYMKQ